MEGKVRRCTHPGAAPTAPGPLGRRNTPVFWLDWELSSKDIKKEKIAANSMKVDGKTQTGCGGQENEERKAAAAETP